MPQLAFDILSRSDERGLDQLLKVLDKLAGKIEGLGGIKAKPEVDVDTSKAEKKVGAFGEHVAAIAATAGLAAGAALTGGILGSLNTEKANDKLAAQLGATPQMAAELGKVAGDLYSQAYGESLEGVNDAIRAVMQGGLIAEDDTPEVLKDITAQVLDLSSAFGTDLAGTTEAVGQLLKTGLAPNAQAALDVVTRGFQEGANRSDDFLDTLTEYAVQFDKFGLSATSATGLLVQGMKAGARNSDLVADAIKEFSIRAVDGSKLTADGFKAVGLDANKMAKEIAKGGPTAEKALDLTLDRLRAMPDPIQRSQAAVALFGTQAEDLGDALFALDPSQATDRLGHLADASKNLGKTLNDNAATNIESFKRQVTTTFVSVVGGSVIPRVQEFASTLATRFGPALQASTEWIKDNQEWLKPLGVILGTVTGTVLVLVGVTKAWAAAQAALNVVLAANPIGVVIVVVAALVAGLIYAYNHSEKFRQIVQAAWQGIQATVSWAWNNVIKPAWDAFAWYLQNVLGPVVTWLWNTIIKPTFSALGGHIKWVWDTIIRPAFGALNDGILWVANTFRDGVAAIGRHWDSIKAKTVEPINFVIGTVFNNGITRAWNTIAGFVGLPKLPMLPLIGAGGGAGGGGAAQRYMNTGGPVPGQGNRDTVNAKLTPGEYVLSKPAVASLGGLAVVDALHKAARSSRSLGEILFGGDRGGPGVAYFAEGGAVLRGLAWARSQTGKPYVFGGVGPNGYDCSGLMSGLVGVLTGGNPYVRRFSTASFAGGRSTAGFVPGLRSAFGIGVVQGRPGHMAGTLGGINFEATPPRVRMGSGARGADDRLFTHRYSLPQVGGEFVGGGGGGFLSFIKGAFDAPLRALNGLAQFGSSQFVNGVAALSKKLIVDTVSTMLKQMPGFGTGGIVPGPIGRPRAVIAHGGEHIGYGGGTVILQANVIGSQRELDNWLTAAVDRLGSKGRITVRG